MTKLVVNGINLYYEITGTGQPLLFIHGLGSSTRDWQAQAEYFCSDYRVVTFDLRGHGQSDKPRGPYSIPLFASDTAGLLKALGTGPADVVGLSLGGGVAFQLALDYPDLVRKMVIVNSAPELVVRTFKDRVAIWQRLAIVQVLGMRRMGEVLSKRLFPAPEQQELRTAFIESWGENNPRAYLDATRAMVGWSVTDRLGSIRCPTLILSSDQDYTPVALKEEYAKRIPGARVAVLAGVHHAAPVEKPAEFNAAVAEFLA